MRRILTAIGDLARSGWFPAALQGSLSAPFSVGVPSRYGGHRPLGIVLGVDPGERAAIAAAFPDWRLLFAGRKRNPARLAEDVHRLGALVIIGPRPTRSQASAVLSADSAPFYLSRAPLPRLWDGTRWAVGYVLEPHSRWTLCRRTSEMDRLLARRALGSFPAMMADALALAERLDVAMPPGSATLRLEPGAADEAPLLVEDGLTLRLRGGALQALSDGSPLDLFDEALARAGTVVVPRNHPLAVAAHLMGRDVVADDGEWPPHPLLRFPREEVLAAAVLWAARYVQGRSAVDPLDFVAAAGHDQPERVRVRTHGPRRRRPQTVASLREIDLQSVSPRKGALEDAVRVREERTLVRFAETQSTLREPAARSVAARRLWRLHRPEVAQPEAAAAAFAAGAASRSTIETMPADLGPEGRHPVAVTAGGASRSTIERMRAGLGPEGRRAIAAAFAAAENAVSPPSAVELRALASCPTAELDEMAARVFGDGDSARARRALAIAALLATDAGSLRRRTALQRAFALATPLVGDEAARDELRAAVYQLIEASAESDALIVLHLLAVLGDVGFVRAASLALGTEEMLVLLSLLPERFRHADGHLVYDIADEFPATTLAFVDADAPPSLLGDCPGPLCAASEARLPAPLRNLLTEYVPHYSAAEDRLSALTERVAAEVMDRYVAPFEASPLAPAATLLRHFALQIDDTLFRALKPAAALAAAVETEAPSHVALACPNAERALALAGLIEAVRPATSVTIILPPWANARVPEKREATAANPAAAVRDLSALCERWSVLGDATATEPFSIDATHRRALFIGHLEHRNYVVEARELSIQAAATGHTVDRIPTVIRRSYAEIITEFGAQLLKRSEATQYTLLPLAVADRAARQIPRSLVDHAEATIADVLGAAGAHRALLALAEGPLRRVLTRAPANLAAVAALRSVLRRIRPTTVVALPGRDWMVRVVASEVRAARPRASALPVTIDVQTVFVGPRSRYKPTSCDIQLVIDTTSREIFRQYFSLPDSRIVVGGSIRYANAAATPLPASTAGAPGPWRLLFTASSLLDECLPILAALVEFVDARDDVHLLVRAHPDTSRTVRLLFREVLAPVADKAAMDEDRPFTAALAETDCVVTRFSNTGLEAAIAGRPVVACSLGTVRPPIRLDEMGIALAATSREELRSVLAELREGGSRLAALEASRERYFAMNPVLKRSDAAAAVWQTIARLTAPAGIDRDQAAQDLIERDLHPPR